MINLKLFIIFFKIGLFTLGGGPAMIPVVRYELVDKRNLISEEDFLDSVAFSSSLPGAIIVNIATFVGYKISKTKGAILSAFGAILPAYFAIVLLVPFIDALQSKSNLSIVSLGNIIDEIFLGIRPTVIVLILLAIYQIGKSTYVDYVSILVAIVASILLFVFKLSVFNLILLAFIFGILKHIYKRYYVG